MPLVLLPGSCVRDDRGHPVRLKVHSTMTLFFSEPDALHTLEKHKQEQVRSLRRLTGRSRARTCGVRVGNGKTAGRGSGARARMWARVREGGGAGDGRGGCRRRKGRVQATEGEGMAQGGVEREGPCPPTRRHSLGRHPPPPPPPPPQEVVRPAPPSRQLSPACVCVLCVQYPMHTLV